MLDNSIYEAILEIKNRKIFKQWSLTKDTYFNDFKMSRISDWEPNLLQY